MRIYPGMGHTINADEITHARNLLQNVSLRKRLDPARK